MKFEKVLSAVAIFGVGIWMPTLLGAREREKHSGKDPSPVIITFDIGTNQSTGFTNCFGSCPGTVAVNGNAEGAVVGYFVADSGVFYGFVRWPNGKIETISPKEAGTLPGQGTVPYSINSWGAIAGQYQDSAYAYHGFLRWPDGRIVSFDIPNFQAGVNQGPDGTSNINDAGEIAGYYLDANFVNHGFVRYLNGHVQTFDVANASTLANDPPQGTVMALESGLNNLGATTGWYFDSNNATHGYVRDGKGNITTFDSPDGGTGFFQGTIGGSINDEGVIAGGILDGNYVYHGFVRFPNGTLKPFDAPGGGTTQGSFQGTVAVGINNEGTITAYVTDTYNVTHGAIRTKDGNISIFDVKQEGTGTGQGTTPQGITATGVVMGYYTDNSNVNHGFLLIPAPSEDQQ